MSRPFSAPPSRTMDDHSIPLSLIPEGTNTATTPTMANTLTAFGTAFEPVRPRDNRLQLNPAGPDSQHPSRSGTPTTKAASRTPKPETLNDSIQTLVDDRPLNVTDALSYLDAVKVQFQEQPEVYNHFLDIMKDFKSEQIDTPGVINRVSVLFHKTPYLIQGFNTFLPTGYRIDVSSNPNDSTITVTTPLGTTTQSTTLGIRRDPLDMNFANGANNMNFSSSTLAPIGSAPHTPHGYNSLTPVPQLTSFDLSFSPGVQNNQTAAAASFLGNLNNRNLVAQQESGQQQGEFNHAIQYLNKIKARYSDDTSTYKQFLEILQTYQKEQKHSQNSQVYVQVQKLFRDDPDLLAEFKDFLPEVGFQQSGQAILPQPSNSMNSAAGWNTPDVEKSPKKNNVPLKRKKKSEKDTTPVPVVKQLPPSRQAKKPKHTHKQDPGSPTYSSYLDPPSPPSSHQPIQQDYVISHSVFINSGGTSPDKLVFFDRAKKNLENRDVWDEFLKLLSLFAREIIDMDTLVEQSRVFLGDGDLMADFKDLIGWKDRAETVESGPPGSIRTAAPEALAALPTDDGQGPSYRRLAESEVRLACSGRDQLARSVLNDVWVSHPTWASEEAGFHSHKKNTFEEALHKSEEERHEYHVHIQGLTRTIAVLEPLSARLEDMSSDDRSSYRLKADFGGSAKCIYHRVIKKVWGRDAGMEVIQALQECPNVAVPVVLARLKQKDEEWRRAQREWSRTWRDVDARNFYKSLDHQGISFKANDKKNITAKHFVAEIEGIKSDQEQARTDGPSFSRQSTEHQMKFFFHDTDVLHDSLKMVYSFLDRSTGQYNYHERSTVERFLRGFTPMLFQYPVSEFNAACGPLESSQDEDLFDFIATNGDFRNGRRSGGSSDSSSSKKKESRSAGYSRDASPEPIDDVWIEQGASGSSSTNGQPDSLPNPFFANTTFYTLLRLLQLLYSRLLMCKEIGRELAETNHELLLANPVAVELGLDDPSGPPAVLAQAKESLGKFDETKNNLVYIFLLDACVKVFDGELDQATFEEYMRWFFGNKAFHIFTIDKVIVALIKQVQTILVDNKCQELLTLFQRARCSDSLNNHAIIRYRREAEQHVGLDEHLYSLEWAPSSKGLRIRLIADADPSLDGEDPFREYADSYCLTLPTEHLPRRVATHSRIFLRRNLPSGDLSSHSRKTHGKLEIHLVERTCRLVYGAGRSEVLYPEKLDLQLVERARFRESQRAKCLYLE